MNPRWRLAALGASTLVAASGCGLVGGFQSMHLPGGGAPGPQMTVHAYFSNVNDLVPQAAVKAGDVTVGSVQSVHLVRDPAHPGAYVADVAMSVQRSAKLPANAEALEESTSLLGEKFVQLQAPTGQPPAGPLTDNAVLASSRTASYPDVEEVFGLLASVLNGGGLEKLQTINTELAAALNGREKQVHDVVGQLATFIGGLDSQRNSITNAITDLDALARTLNAQTTSINFALDNLAPGIAVLAQERAKLTELLTSLGNLGVVSTQVINASADNTKANLESLQPILSRVAAAGQSLPRSLEILLTYPFPRHATNSIKGDGVLTYLTADGKAGCALLMLPTPVCTAVFGVVPDTGATASPLPAPASAPATGSPSAPAVPPVPQPGATVPGVPLQLPPVPLPPVATGGSSGSLFNMLSGGLL